MTPIGLDLSNYRLNIVKPDIHISTKEAYAGVTPRESEVFLPEVLKKEPKEWNNRVVNDFEEPLFPKIPALKTVKEELYREGALYASMSGSGSAFFGIFLVC
jgi:4-diphosphocytidyl-2-C-methyl-D-erythritol kinase